MKRLHAVLSLGAGLALAGAALVPAAPALADAPHTYHVDCSRKTDGDGISSPWRSLSAIRSHGAFAPGDTILFKRGTVCRGRLTTAGSGTSSRRIRIGAEGRGSAPLIRGGGTGDWTGAVELRNQEYWTIEDLAVTNTAGGRSSRLYRAGVLLWNDGGGTLSGVTVRRMHVSSVASNMSYSSADPREWGGIAAITIDRNGSNGFHGLLISKNEITNVGRTGVIVSNHGYPRQADSATRVTGNRVDRSRGDGIVMRGAVGGRIDANRVSNASSQWPCSECGRISPQTANAAIWTALSKSVRIDHNEAWRTFAKGGDGEGFDVDASAVNTVVEYNYAHDNEGGGIIFCASRNATVRFNIFENNQKSAFTFIGSMPAKNTSIYNNTVFQSRGTKAGNVRYFNGPHGSGIKFFNNIVYNFGTGKYLWPTRPQTAANQLIGVHGAGRPTDGRTSWRDPGLKAPGTGGNGVKTLGGYRPRHPSLLLRGVAIPKSVTRDFFGKRIDPAKPPRGAAG